MGGAPTESIVDDVIEFWFERGIVPGFCEYRPVWFGGTPEMDAEIADRFRAVHGQAAAGALDGLADTARGAVALVIVLDQFSRQLFRNDARSFATDAQAAALARRSIKRGFDAALPAIWRIFLYLPFQHSEDLADQQWSVELFDRLGGDVVFRFIQDAARGHLDVIERFGRFPHRNAVLGRKNTPEEQAFLEGPEGKFWGA